MRYAQRWCVQSPRLRPNWEPWSQGVDFATIPLVLMCMQMQMQKKIACNVLGRPISIYPDVNVILDVDEILIASGSDWNCICTYSAQRIPPRYDITLGVSLQIPYFHTCWFKSARMPRGKFKFSDEGTEKLIELVRKNLPLYDVSRSEHRDALYTKNVRESIAEIIEIDLLVVSIDSFSISRAERDKNGSVPRKRRFPWSIC